MLPVEMLIQVFSHLDMRSLAAASRVCHRFLSAVLRGCVWRGRTLSWDDEGLAAGRSVNTLLTILRLAPCLDAVNLRHVPAALGGQGSPLLCGRLRDIRSLRVSDHELCTDNIARVLRRFGGTLQHLDLKLKMYYMTERMVLELWESVNQMRRLRSLRLAGYLPCRLTYTFPERALPDQTLIALDLHDFETDHAVTMLSLIMAHSSTIAKLTMPDSLSEDEVRRALDTLRVAEDVDMTVGGHIAHLNGLPIKRLTLRHKDEACSARFLEHVNECSALAGVQELTVCWSDGDLRDAVLSSLARHCGDLRVLRLRNMCDDKAPALIHTVREFSQIRELDLNKFYPMDVQFVDEIAVGALPALTRMYLRDILIGVPHADASACDASPCYEHHFDRLSAHRRDLSYVFHDFPQCWHRRSTISQTLSCYCAVCLDFYGYMMAHYNGGQLPGVWT
ncbi:hypothetical protein ONE63_002753 [Megalurothrips usitatus]|uniref:F-box domain-containing protein n=1 Tax=Megalurothrips usitatus TaxID=439358 RepID=A0AAV7X8L2_9NEOP|nr:hypothetical protein ONE63_002753 [Megalurothrips usitatus]